MFIFYSKKGGLNKKKISAVYEGGTVNDNICQK